MFGIVFGLASGIVLPPSLAWAGPHFPGPFVADRKLDRLKQQMQAPGARLEVPCLEQDAEGCARGALDRVRAKLASRPNQARGPANPVRILQLGDSHIAADYITSRIRRDFQTVYGVGGRGFVHVDQPWGYGGRRTWKSKTGWVKDRIVDTGRAGRPYGFSGVSLTAQRKGAAVQYRVRPDDRVVRLFFGPKKGARVEVRLDKKTIGRFDLSGPAPVVAIPLPERQAKKQRRGPPGNTLRIIARNKGVALYGLSFESASPKSGRGVQYSSIGPVGADAKVYLQLQRASFTQHLEAYAPDLVVYMVGGNDALKIRKRWTNLDRVTRDHEQLFRLVRKTVPDADCIVWAPMVAGRRRGGRVVSKRYLEEVRDMQRRVAIAEGCAFWDTMGAMGGAAAIARWAPAMHKDLVHPRKAAADLLGRMFVRAWMNLE